MARTNRKAASQFIVRSYNAEHAEQGLNAIYREGYDRFKTYTTVDADGCRVFTFEGKLNPDRHEAGVAAGAPDFYAVRTCAEAKLEETLNELHGLGFDPRQQFVHKDGEGKRWFTIIGTTTEERYEDPSQLELDGVRGARRD